MTTEETPQQSAQISAGEQLRRAREAAGMSVAEVAERQHLRPSIIQAIESGDYQQIDTELFLKGYVRAYAGQVGLAPDVVIAQLDQELEPVRREREMAEEENPLQDIERRKRRKKRVARLIGFLLILGFLAYVGLRLLAPIENTPEQDAAPAQESGVTEPIAEQPLATQPEVGAEPEQDLQPEPIPEPVPADRAPEPDTVQAESVLAVEPAQDPAEAPGPDTAVEPVPEARVAEPSVDAPPVPAPPVTEPQVVAEPVAPADPVPAGPDVALAASFIAPCWVEITDANGQRLVAALFRSGDELRVDGEPPMRVVLGAADAVSELQFSGEIIDLSTYRTVNNRVEFTLDI